VGVGRVGEEVVDVPGLLGDASKPCLDGGPAVELVPGFMRYVCLGVDGDVGDRVPVGDEEFAPSEMVVLDSEYVFTRGLPPGSVGMVWVVAGSRDDPSPMTPRTCTDHAGGTFSPVSER